MALDRNDLELLRDMMREVSLEVTKESETRMMAYIESHVEKKIDTLADGLLATNERIDRLTERMDDMNETVLANTMYIVKDARDKGQAQSSVNLLVFEHVFHTNTKLPTVFTLLGAIFYAYLVDNGWSK